MSLTTLINVVYSFAFTRPPTPEKNFRENWQKGAYFPMIYQVKSMEGLESERHTPPPPKRGAKLGGLHYSLYEIIKI